MLTARADTAWPAEATTPTGEPFARSIPWLLLGAGVVGTLAALGLTVERMRLLENPAYVPTCSLNPVVSCGSVMTSAQAELFGFANSLIGLVGFPIVAATGATLLAGATLRRWYWLSLQVGVTAGFALVAWLILQSLFRIGALCPYCMVVWAVTLPVAWYVTLANLSTGRLRLGSDALVRAATRQHGVILTLGYVVIAGLVTWQFWDYWTGLAR